MVLRDAEHPQWELQEAAHASWSAGAVKAVAVPSGFASHPQAGAWICRGRVRDGIREGSAGVGAALAAPPSCCWSSGLWLVGLQNLSAVKPNANNLCSWGRVSDL